MAKQQRHKWVLDWSDERSFGNGHFVELIYGRAFYPDADEGSASHVLSFDTVKDALKAIRNSQPCNCQRCKNGQESRS